MEEAGWKSDRSSDYAPTKKDASFMRRIAREKRSKAKKIVKEIIKTKPVIAVKIGIAPKEILKKEEPPPKPEPPRESSHFFVPDDTIEYVSPLKKLYPDDGR